MSAAVKFIYQGTLLSAAGTVIRIGLASDFFKWTFNFKLGATKLQDLAE